LSLTGFLLLEQILITDGTVVPLNRLRIIYAFGAAIALFVFGIGAAVVASRGYNSYPYNTYYHSKHSLNIRSIKKRICLFFLDAIIAAVIAFIGAAVYIGEAVARNRKSRII
jgi:hypothetical protein